MHSPSHQLIYHENAHAAREGQGRRRAGAECACAASGVSHYTRNRNQRKGGAARMSCSLFDWVKALPHNSSAALAMPFLPSASCRNLDLHPVNLRFLQSHLTKNAFAIAPTHLCGIALRQRRTIRRRVGRCLFRQPTTSFVRCYLNMRSAV